MTLGVLEAGGIMQQHSPDFDAVHVRWYTLGVGVVRGSWYPPGFSAPSKR
jgi:hypothetical protein